MNKRQADEHKKQIVIAQKERQQANKLNIDLQKQSPPPGKKIKSTKKSFWEQTKKLIVAASVIVGLVVAAYGFRPQLSIQPDLTLNPKSPFSTQFKITNTGLLALHDLHFSCTWSALPNFRDIETSDSGGQETVDMLRSGDSATKNCSVEVPGFNIPIDLKFSVIFTPLFLSSIWNMKITRHFATVRDSEGRLRWIQQPESSK